jgi:hypothetical protein
MKLLAVVACGNGSFIFTAVWCLTVEINCNSFMHSPVNGHLSAFPFFAILDSAAINTLHLCCFPREETECAWHLHIFQFAGIAKLFCSIIVAI